MINNSDSWSDAEFEELKKSFYSEAYEIADTLRDLILSLENSGAEGEALKALKRHIHTLKGDSITIGLASVGNLCHRMEDMLSPLMSGASDFTHEFTDLLLVCVDAISRLLSESESCSGETGIEEIVDKIDVFLRREAEHSSPISPQTGIAIPGYTEYQELQIRDAAKNGLNIYEMEIGFHPMCGDRGAAALMLIQRVNALGQVIRPAPDVDGSDIDGAEKMTILFSSDLTDEKIRKNVFIAGITDEINIRVRDCGSFHNFAPSQLPSHKSEMLRIEASRVDNIMDLVGELIIGRSMIDHLAADIRDGASTGDVSERLYIANTYMERIVSDLQRGVMRMRMVTINHVFRKFSKIVRDLSAEKGKKAALDIRGKDTELDKGIVDALGEPLSHIVRNIIDHGIEEPAFRKSAGKPEEGLIALNAYHDSGRIVIEISDDGGGIDTEKLKKRAIELGLLAGSEAEKLSDREAVNLIFLPGLSTSEAISETSGRGIGMDAVKTALENMKGDIEVESIPGAGTKFTLRLPLTLAVIKALLFGVEDALYAIPISAIAEVARIHTDELITVDGRDTLLLRDRIISIIRSQELLRTISSISSVPNNGKKFVLILSIGKRNIGLLVDRLVGQQEVVIKGVAGHYAQSGLVSGASILGNGRVILILDAPAIFRKAIEDEKERMVA